MPLHGPILQAQTARFSDKLKSQDRAECGNKVDFGRLDEGSSQTKFGLILAVAIFTMAICLSRLVLSRIVT